MKEKTKFIIGKKIGMTQIYDEDGNQLPVTVLKVGPCKIVQKKSCEKEGYSSLQLGFVDGNVKGMNKPMLGHLRKHGIEDQIKVLKEFRVDSKSLLNQGDTVDTAMFLVNDKVNICGVSIGKGFQGTVKRWHFNVGPMAHGSKNHRIPGSIGAGSGQSRVLKGKKMYGHMGNVRVTVEGLKVVRILPEQNIIMVNGSVPGKKNSLVTVTA